MPITKVRTSDIPEYCDSIYELSQRDVFNIMLTGYSNGIINDAYDICFSKYDICTATGKTNSDKINEISIRHVLITGIDIYQQPHLTSYKIGYNKGLSNIIQHFKIDEEIADATAKFITDNNKDRFNATTINYNNLVEYFYAKGVIQKQTQVSFCKDFMLLKNGNETRLSHTSNRDIHEIGGMFMFTLLTRLFEYLYINKEELQKEEVAYLNALIKQTWICINKEYCFKRMLKIKGLRYE